MQGAANRFVPEQGDHVELGVVPGDREALIAPPSPVRRGTRHTSLITALAWRLPTVLTAAPLGLVRTARDTPVRPRDGSRPGWPQPRPTYGIPVAMTVSVSTLASGGRSAM